MNEPRNEPKHDFTQYVSAYFQELQESEWLPIFYYFTSFSRFRMSIKKAEDKEKKKTR